MVVMSLGVVISIHLDVPSMTRAIPVAVGDRNVFICSVKKEEGGQGVCGGGVGVVTDVHSYSEGKLGGPTYS